MGGWIWALGAGPQVSEWTLSGCWMGDLLFQRARAITSDLNFEAPHHQRQHQNDNHFKDAISSMPGERQYTISKSAFEQPHT